MCIFLQTFSQAVIVAEYYANKDYIAKNLCENRDKPMLHCNGKCCLKKKLAQDSKEQAPASRLQKSEQVVLFYSNTNFQVSTFSHTTPAAKYFTYDELQTASFHHSVFHPPSAC